MGLEPGYLISPHVKLVRMLKRGGMGSVWIAEHLGLSTQVAVKFIATAVAHDPAMVARFTREATLAAQIKSPHVVHIYDHGITPGGDPFIIMELLEGEDLQVRLKREGTLSVQVTATILLQTGKVLSKAHQIGVVHRDIKPSNLFLLESDEDEIFVKLLDFGVAKTSEGTELTSTGAMVGTVVYMSPEQLVSARRVDHRADLWSLAVVAYRALTGALPFKDDEGLGALCRSLESGIFFPPTDLVPALPRALNAWFERAFKRDPAERFASAREFVEEFFLAGGIVGGLGPPSSRSASRPPGMMNSPVRITNTKLDLTALKRTSPPPPAARRTPEPAAGVGSENGDISAKSPDGPRSGSIPTLDASSTAARAELADRGRSPSVSVMPERSAAMVEEIGSIAAASAAPRSLGGEPHAPPRRSPLRARMVTFAAILGLVGVSVGGARTFGVPRFVPARWGASLAGQPTATGVDVALAPAAAPAGPVASALDVAPASTTSGASLASPRASSPAGSTSASAYPRASASARAVPSSASKPAGATRGPTRIRKPEKDYGF
jgi:eukaryotic-like serine/threonine-protein kinase